MEAEERGVATARARLADRRSEHVSRLVAHEVRNALAGIGGALEVVRKRLTPEQALERDACLAMQQRLRRLDELMDDLIGPAAPGEPRRERVALADVARTSAAVIGAERGRRTGWIEVRAQDELAVTGDREQLELLLHSMLSAALAALGAENGPLVLTVVRRGTQAVIEATAPRPGAGPNPWSRARLPLALARRLISQHEPASLQPVGEDRLRLQLPLV